MLIPTPSITSIATAIVLVLTGFFFYHLYWKRRKLPPGPTPLPFIGNLRTLAKYPPGEECHLKWLAEYGPVYTYWVGSMPVVCVSDHATIMGTFHRDGRAYEGRTTFEEMDEVVKGGTHGVFNVEGELWRDQRKLAQRVLSANGNNGVMEERVLNKVRSLLASLDKSLRRDSHAEIDLKSRLELATGSVINDILFGQRFTESNLHDYHRLKSAAECFFSMLRRPAVQILLSKPKLLRYLPVFSRLHEEVVGAAREFFGYFDEKIREHLTRMEADEVEEEAESCLTHVFLLEKQRRDRLGEDHFYTLIQLKNVCFDMWLDAQLTTSSVAAWAVAYLVTHPDAQRRLHAELDSVIGDPERVVIMADRPNLSYANAVVNETLRAANVVPENVLHRTTADVTICGHAIAKGTCIVPQISAVLHNPKTFPEPKAFRPERFLDDNGQLAKRDELIPFSVGKRKCIGEPLARMEIFLLVANLFNQYEITSSTKVSAPSLERTNGGIVVTCPEFRCQLQQRRG